jgi:hypothetical protein
MHKIIISIWLGQKGQCTLKVVNQGSAALGFIARYTFGTDQRIGVWYTVDTGLMSECSPPDIFWVGGKPHFLKASVFAPMLGIKQFQ